jgi:hypothetical protein
MSMTESEPFLVSMPKFNVLPLQTSQELTATTKLTWLNYYTVTATLSSTWSLTGEHLGQKFGAVSSGE